MPRNFRQSRFRASEPMGEDVNPSAYIVNLADCMLVLACGFMVALIVHWGVEVVPTTELDSESLEQIDPEVVPEDLKSGGSSYVEAGTVYRDPATGNLYLVEGAEGSSSDESANSDDADSPSSSASSQEDIRNARASGAE